jgi:hypothetical protein
VCQQGTRLTNNILKLKITTKKSSLESVRQIIRQKPAKRKKADELINSFFPKFPHIFCLSGHHLKQIEMEQINVEGYKLGAAYCRKSLLKGGVCIFVPKKYNYSNMDLSKYCKEQDIEAYVIKLELTALNIYVVNSLQSTM